MLTRAGYALMAASLILFVSGLPTGNLYVLALSMLPLAFFMLSALAAKPRQVKVETLLPADPPRAGRPFVVIIRYEVTGGQGLVEIHQPLPGVFERLDGSNLVVIAKGPGRARGERHCVVQAPRRGLFELPPATWELVPALGLTESMSGTTGSAQELHVRPALTSFKRMASARTKATSLLPENDDARMGIQTTEFRDLRTYQRGDPPRTINWKATARAMARAEAARPVGTPGEHQQAPVVPLVNDYEFEGKKSVWIFLDCGPHMRVGTSAQNAFEAAVHAAQGTASFFIDRGYQVGFTAYNHPEQILIYPDTGKRQMLRIREEAAGLEPTTTRNGLVPAVEQAKRFLLRSKGLVVVVTRADTADQSLIAGLRRLRGLAGRRTQRRRVPILVVSPDPYSLVPDGHDGTAGARMVQRYLDHENLKQVRRLGVELLHWDPSKVRFQTLLARRASR